MHDLVHASCPSDAAHPLPLAAANASRLVYRSPTLRPPALLMMLIKYAALLAGVVGATAQACSPSDADLNTVLQITLAQSTKLLAQRAAVSCLTDCIGGGVCTCAGGITGGTGAPPPAPGPAPGPPGTDGATSAVTVHVDPDYLSALGDSDAFADCFLTPEEIASDPDAAALAASFIATTAAQLGVDPSTINLNGISTDSDPAPGCQGNDLDHALAMTVDDTYADALGDDDAFADCWLSPEEQASDPDAAAFVDAFIQSTAAQLGVDPSTIAVGGISTAGLAEPGCGTGR